MSLKFTRKSNEILTIQPVKLQCIFSLPTPPLGQDMTQGQILSGV